MNGMPQIDYTIDNEKSLMSSQNAYELQIQFKKENLWQERRMDEIE
jgi:hypothetical protein